METYYLAPAERKRLRDMAQQWERWARHTHALPGSWQPQYGAKTER